MKRLLIGVVILWSVCLSAIAQATAFTDLKFGQYQIADSQWDVGACLYTSTCNIYSTNPGTMYKIPWYNGQWSWQSGQYVKFVASGISGYPYTANVYNSNGTLAGSIGSGKIINMGVDANGYALFFFVGTDDNTGQLFSTNHGFTGTGGYSWTGTLNPTTSQVDSFATSYGSTTPLASGTTYTPAPAGPTVTGGTITTTNWSGNEVITSGGSSTAGYTGTQQTRVTTWTNGSQSYNNILYVEQTYGDNNQVSITQDGVRNRIDFSLNGNGNVVNTSQKGSNYLKEEIPGWGNNITINQTNTATTNYAETKIQGNGNTVNHTQTGPGNHVLFNTSAGDINTINVTQSGTAGHYAETKLTGNFNNVKVDQSGSTQNKANIDVTNSGGAANIDLQQTGGKNFTIIQNCLNPAGCGTVVRQ